MTTVAIASGYFDPLHIGHIEYFKQAQQLAGRLIVIVNNDKQAELKKGHPFMNQEDRVDIVRELRCVDDAFISIDTDRSVCETIKMLARGIMKEQPDAEILFVNGGDRFAEEIPESRICEEHGIRLVDGLGEKIRSSSALVSKSQAHA